MGRYENRDAVRAESMTGFSNEALNLVSVCQEKNPQEKTGNKKSDTGLRNHKNDLSIEEMITKQIDDGVTERLKKGDAIVPTRDASAHAREIAKDILSGKLVSNKNDVHEFFNTHESNTDSYQEKAIKADHYIDDRERSLGLAEWNALSPEEKKTIEKESAQKTAYFQDFSWTLGPKPPATIHLQAFENTLKNDFEPLDQELQKKFHKIWDELPQQTKSEILRRDEDKKYIHFQ